MVDLNIDAVIQQVGARLLALLADADDRAEPVLRQASPDTLDLAFRAAGAPLPIAPDQPPVGDAALLGAVDEVLRWSVRTLHPRFFNQNFAGPDPVAVLGDWLGAALNTTQATFEVAPVFTLMEREVMAALAARAGFATHEGLFLPGGSMANLHALHLARWRAQPESLRTGKIPGRLVAFTSAEAHYSLGKAMALLGLGSDNLVRVPTGPDGGMDVVALDRAIRQAKRRHDRPFFINATAGTTVRAAFDPLRDLADVADFHDLWLHVDGAFGGSALFSARERHRMDGVARAHSLAWNLHKMVGATQQCAAFLVREPGLLARVFGGGADYLFQPDKPYAHLDSGDRTYHCARRVDALKAWLLWKARGDAGLGARVERAVDLATHAEARVTADPRFALVAPRTFSNVLLWWVPPDLRPLALDAPGVAQRLNRVTVAIKDRMQRDGQTMLSYMPLGERPNALRLLCLNPATTTAEVDAVLELIDGYGQALPRPV